MEDKKIESFGLPIRGAKIKTALQKIVAIPSVIAPIIALPDHHQKSSLDAPTSIVVATKGMIIPSLSTPTLGCSMGLIKTNLTESDLTPEFLNQFFLHIKDHLIFKPYSRTELILRWLGLKKDIPNGSSDSYDFTKEEYIQAARFGASSLTNKYKLEQSIINSIDGAKESARIDVLEGYSVGDIIPRAALVFGRSNVGYGFHGNHFLEIQVVDEIIDTQTSEMWGLKKGQVVISYHGGEGSLAFYVGRYFTESKKVKLKERVTRLFAKLVFHGLKLKGWHILRRPFIEISVDSREGRRYQRAIQAGRNVSQVTKLAMIRRITDALVKSSKKSVNVSLLWDTAHTSISEETISGEDVIIHRNGAVRVTPDKPVLISGSDTVRTYVGIGNPKSESYFYSADHGCGETIKEFTTKGEKPEEALDLITSLLERSDIISPVAYIRPIKTFRD